MKTLFKWIVLSLAVYAAGYFIAGIFVMDVWSALLAGAILLFLNTVVKPVIKLLTLPLTILSFGLFSFVLNGLFFLFVSKLMGGFTVDGFLPALWGSILVSLITWLADKISG